MEKQILSEEFRRMQKLAGIITENEDNTMSDGNITPMDFLQDVGIEVFESKEEDLEEAKYSTLKTIGEYALGIILFAVSAPFMPFWYVLGKGMGGDVKKLKWYYKNYQMGKEIDENQVRAIIEKLTNELNSLSPQKKRFLKTILDDLSDAGNEYAQNPSVGKSKILGIEKKLNRVLDKYDLDSPEELANIDGKIFYNPSTPFNPPLEFLPDPKN